MTPIARRITFALLALMLALPILACGSLGVQASRGPRWACPSPTPLPFGEDGPVKRETETCAPDPVTGVMTCTTVRERYEVWEQEYGHLGGPPFPPPTPYALVGTSYVFGQRVEVWPFHLRVDASAGPLVNLPGVAPGSQQLYTIELTWVSHLPEAVPVSYGEHVRLRAITDASGALQSDSRWGVTATALQLAGVDSLPDTIPPGESRVTIPVLAPPGEPEVVEVVFDAASGADSALATPVPTVSAGDLRAQGDAPLAVTWSNARWEPPGAEPCGDPGALTDWSGDGAEGIPYRMGVPAPPGADRLVQVALGQVGKRYIWGAKGPEAFDCSGLVSWSYAQIGVRIPQGTGGQWPGLREVTEADLRPGDLVFFDIQGRGKVDHVGMLVGDLNGDGSWDMVHAASPELGVRVELGIFSLASYASRIRGFRTAR